MKITWRRSTEHYVESTDGYWWITPIYGGLTRPEGYILNHNPTGVTGGWRVVGSGETQKECKIDADRLLASSSSKSDR